MVDWRLWIALMCESVCVCVWCHKMNSFSSITFNIMLSMGSNQELWSCEELIEPVRNSGAVRKSKDLWGTLELWVTHWNCQKLIGAVRNSLDVWGTLDPWETQWSRKEFFGAVRNFVSYKKLQSYEELIGAVRNSLELLETLELWWPYWNCEELNISFVWPS